MRPLTVDEVMTRIQQAAALDYSKRNAIFERECYQQACTELEISEHSAYQFITKVSERAQQIKAARRANGEGL